MLPPEHPPHRASLDGFATTAWSIVLAAGDQEAGSESSRSAALARLCRAYWSPIYTYARRLGLSPHDAEDATQGFFAYVLANDWVQRADPERGSFRGFLLQSFRFFLSNENQRATAARRGGKERAVVPLDTTAAEPLIAEALQAQRDPADEFERAFALTLMERAATRLAEESSTAGPAVAAQFARLRPFLQQAPGPGDYATAAQDLGITPGYVAVLVHRFTRRFRDLVRAEAAETLADRTTVDAELRHLLQALEK